MTRREVTLPTADYIARFRRADEFMEACRACPGFGRTWACPPFDFDVEARLSRYPEVRIIAYTFEVPAGTDLSTVEAFRQFRKPMNEEVLRLERELGGFACSFGGACDHCASCTRGEGRACRHPELVRPALEAYGFDLGLTLSELFGLPLEWSTTTHTPKHLTLIGAVFS